MLYRVRIQCNGRILPSTLGRDTAPNPSERPLFMERGYFFESVFKGSTDYDVTVVERTAAAP
jgi:hypothetical protein